ncbi:hypothetical protein MASR2M32_06740 [Sphaerotilus sulfidivorans]
MQAQNMPILVQPEAPRYAQEKNSDHESAPDEGQKMHNICASTWRTHLIGAYEITPQRRAAGDPPGTMTRDRYNPDPGVHPSQDAGSRIGLESQSASPSTGASLAGGRQAAPPAPVIRVPLHDV